MKQTKKRNLPSLFKSITMDINHVSMCAKIALLLQMVARCDGLHGSDWFSVCQWILSSHRN